MKKLNVGIGHEKFQIPGTSRFIMENKILGIGCIIFRHENCLNAELCKKALAERNEIVHSIRRIFYDFYISDLHIRGKRVCFYDSTPGCCKKDDKKHENVIFHGVVNDIFRSLFKV